MIKRENKVRKDYIKTKTKLIAKDGFDGQSRVEKIVYSSGYIFYLNFILFIYGPYFKFIIIIGSRTRVPEQHNF